jgi:hypothetical protein
MDIGAARKPLLKGIIPDVWHGGAVSSNKFVNGGLEELFSVGIVERRDREVLLIDKMSDVCGIDVIVPSIERAPAQKEEAYLPVRVGGEFSE